MADLKYYVVIIKPVITEKSMGMLGDKKYTFIVNPDATKVQIHEAVEKMFDGAKVKSVNTMNRRGKNKRRGYTTGRTNDIKRAVVTLTEDSKDIEFFQGI